MSTTFDGTSGDDTFTATGGGVTTINGNGGNDRLTGGWGENHISGGTGNDILQAGAGVNFMLGGVSPADPMSSGKDTFIISLNALNAGAQVTIYDFGGAGGFSSVDNDFVAFTGFSAGSSIASVQDSGVDPNLAYYTIHDALSGNDFMIAIRSTNGAHLGAGDFNFYS